MEDVSQTIHELRQNHETIKQFSQYCRDLSLTGDRASAECLGTTQGYVVDSLQNLYQHVSILASQFDSIFVAQEDQLKGLDVTVHQMNQVTFIRHIDCGCL